MQRALGSLCLSPSALRLFGPSWWCSGWEVFLGLPWPYSGDQIVPGIILRSGMGPNWPSTYLLFFIGVMPVVLGWVPCSEWPLALHGTICCVRDCVGVYGIDKCLNHYAPTIYIFFNPSKKKHSHPCLSWPIVCNTDLILEGCVENFQNVLCL